MSAVDENMTAVSDEELFKQPPRKEDCPICMLLLPTLETGRIYYGCCGKVICAGCVCADAMRNIKDQKCPFCRTPAPTTNEDLIKQAKKRMEVGDVEAIRLLGCYYYHGRYGLPQNNAKALELWRQAGELGNALAYSSIGAAYYDGYGVERDEIKANHYFELGAMRGDEKARHNLGNAEGRKGYTDRALRHFMFAAGSGYYDSLDTVREMFMDKEIAKDDYAKALRAYQAYLGEIKSEQRDTAAALNEQYKYY